MKITIKNLKLIVILYIVIIGLFIITVSNKTYRFSYQVEILPTSGIKELGQKLPLRTIEQTGFSQNQYKDYFEGLKGNNRMEAIKNTSVYYLGYGENILYINYFSIFALMVYTVTQFKRKD
jgi:hypothetical protein